MNKITISGLLVRDSEYQVAQSGMAYCKFTIVNNEYAGKDQNQQPKYDSTFLDCVCLKYCADKAKNLKKSDTIVLEGKLSMDEWEDKNTGQKRTKIKVIIDNFEITVKQQKSQNSQQGYQNQQNNWQQQNQNWQQPQQQNQNNWQHPQNQNNWGNNQGR